MRIVPVNSVASGVLLGQNIYSENGDILLKKGVVLTEHLLQRIVDNNVFTIYVDDGFNDQAIEDVIRPEVRLKAIRSIKETFKQLEGFHKESSNDQLGLKQRLSAKQMELYMGRLKGVCDFVVDDISKNQQLMINLVDIKNLNNYEYEHALQVAILSTVVGIEMRLTSHQLYNLFLGALLHDIGKLFLPKTLSAKSTHLSLEETINLKNHATLGYNYLKDNFQFEIPARIISLQHHECYDGSGYPKGTSSESLHLFSRIVAVCNAYDNMVSDTLTEPAITAHEALEFLMGNAGRCFDFKIVEVFTRKVNPYPVGTLVRLSNGVCACVTKDTLNFPLRPVVQVVNITEKKLDPQIFDLMQVKDLTIIEIVHSIQNT